MKGDFSKWSFESARDYAAVLFQQGRVSLDSDFNDATAILLRQLRALTRDLFGRAGGPADGSGFRLYADEEQKRRLKIGSGHYYVDGILCENGEDCDYADQPFFTPLLPDKAGQGGDPLLRWLDNPDNDERFWVYLDVWERHVSWIEDDRIREAALGGADSCSRVQIVWQVKALPWDAAWDEGGGDGQWRDYRCDTPLGSLPVSTGRLAARLDPGKIIEDPCTIAPEARYRGRENQLYRIEIHQGGDADMATFKWSRDNGSIAARWLGTSGNALIVSAARGFRAGAWVELSHDALELAGLPGELVRVVSVEGDRLTVESAPATAWQPELVNPRVRLWDQKANDDLALDEGAVPVRESQDAPDAEWIDIGEGIQIRFAPGGRYRPGDYWTIRGSAATGRIDWPEDAQEQPEERPAQGIEHHYAPLGILSMDDGFMIRSCRRCLELSEVACRDPNSLPQNRLASPTDDKAVPAPAAVKKQATAPAAAKAVSEPAKTKTVAAPARGATTRTRAARAASSGSSGSGKADT